MALRRRHPVLAFALADQGKPLWSGRQMPEAMAWRVCQYKGVSSSPDLPGGTAGRPLADSSLSSFVIRRPRTCRLCGAVGAASTSCRRGSSLTSTSGHYGPRPATTRIAPRRRVDSIPRSDNAANDRPAPKRAVPGGLGRACSCALVTLMARTSLTCLACVTAARPRAASQAPDVAGGCGVLRPAPGSLWTCCGQAGG